MKKIILGIAIVVSCFLLSIVLLLFYINQQAKQDTKVKSDVILVLGGAVTSGTSCYGPICKEKGFVMKPHYNPCVVARVDQAVALYKEGFAPKILMSGGNDEEDKVNEAETMKKMAIKAGIPAEAILTEKESTSTYENFAYSKKVLNTAGLRSVIVVTEPYHNARAALVASKSDYNYSISPTRTSPCWDENNFFANWNFVKKELVAIAGYKFLNQL